MQREERGHDRARPHAPRGPPQDEEKKNGVDRVEHDGDERVLPAVEAEERHVDHVRDPRQRVPVGGVVVREGPGDVRGAQAGRYVRIRDDVVGIVEVDEVVPRDLGVNGEHGEGERGGDQDRVLSAEC